MFAAGLTGGIGSGKSTVSAMLAERGAVVVDADLIAREVVAPGGAAYEPLVARFGRGVLAPDGTLDRPALAAVVFADPAALADLNAITHPAIGATIAERLAAEAVTDHIVVLDVPLLVESTTLRQGIEAIIVVDVPVEVAVERLVTLRGMTEEEARARITAQASREERLAAADFVIDNRGSRTDLGAAVERCWAWLRERAEAARRPA